MRPSPSLLWIWAVELTRLILGTRGLADRTAGTSATSVDEDVPTDAMTMLEDLGFPSTMHRMS